MEIEAERWRPVVRYEGIYEVSDLGRIRRIRPAQGTRCGVLKTPPDGRGYPQFSLWRGGKYEHGKVHLVVAEAWLGPRLNGVEVCHEDGDPMNCAVSNLRYDTRAGNEQDKRRHGTHHNSVKTHCPKGHEYTPENTYINPRGARECRICKQASRRASASVAAGPAT